MRVQPVGLTSRCSSGRIQAAELPTFEGRVDNDSLFPTKLLVSMRRERGCNVVVKEGVSRTPGVQAGGAEKNGGGGGDFREKTSEELVLQ